MRFRVTPFWVPRNNKKPIKSEIKIAGKFIIPPLAGELVIASGKLIPAVFKIPTT